MAKSHDSFKKRKREFARKEKKEQKRQRKLDKNKKNAESDLNQFQDKVENPQV